jgi:hypothetical protein
VSTTNPVDLIKSGVAEARTAMAEATRELTRLRTRCDLEFATLVAKLEPRGVKVARA